jgi:hypothetical protein
MESGGQGEIGGCGEISTKKSVTWTFGFNLWIGSKWSINMALPKNMEFGMAQYCLLLMIKHFFQPILTIPVETSIKYQWASSVPVVDEMDMTYPNHHPFHC